jgi:hypothetical protein
MADLTITAANITPGTTTGYSPVKVTGTAGETITAGQSVYLSSDGKVYKADANSSSTTAAAVGISLHGATANQPLTYQTGGSMNFGAILTAGTYYVASATAGGIAPTADLTTGWYSTLLMYAYSTSVGIITPTATGIAVA